MVRREWIAIVGCGLFGLILCTLPHWIWFWKLGEPVWVADQDELYYLGVASQSYHEHLTYLGDPTRSAGHGLYQGLPLLPGIWIARLLGLGPQAISLVWRTWGGFLAGVGWYALVRMYCDRPKVALAMTIVLLCDTGMLDFRPFWQIFLFAARTILGQTDGLFDSKPALFKAFRIATPCLTMPYLLLFLTIYARARTFYWLYAGMAAGIGFGLLFYIYFYYWTAAALALGIMAILDAGRRRVAMLAAVTGTLIGLPSLILSHEMKVTTSADWLHRSDKFIPIDRFSELILPRPAIALVAMCGFVVFRYRRELLMPWSMAAASLLLMNHQIVTGLQIENFHWSYVCGPCLALLVAIVVVDAFIRSHADICIFILLGGAILCAVLAIGLRAVEAVRTREQVQILEVYRQYRDQRLHGAAAFPIEPGTTLASDEITTDWAAILERVHPLGNYWVMLSPSVDDEEWDARIALNALLLGDDRVEFESRQHRALSGLGFRGLWGRDPTQMKQRIQSRLSHYDATVSSFSSAIERFGVKYLMLPIGETPHAGGKNWKAVQIGPVWTVWECTHPQPDRR